MRIGLISDTHGRLRNEVFEHFAGVERILHAGDIGPLDLLAELESIAPVTAVYGNTDGFEVRDHVARVAEVEVGGYRIVVMHGDQLGSPTPEGLRDAVPHAGVIVYGHTHRPLIDRAGSSLVVNPGSAGAARFGIAPSLGILTLSESGLDVELVELPR